MCQFHRLTEMDIEPPGDLSNNEVFEGVMNKFKCNPLATSNIRGNLLLETTSPEVIFKNLQCHLV